MRFDLLGNSKWGETHCALRLLTLSNSGPICERFFKKDSIASDTLWSMSFSVAPAWRWWWWCWCWWGWPRLDVVEPREDLSPAILVYVISKPSHSTSSGATGPGDRMLEKKSSKQAKKERAHGKFARQRLLKELFLPLKELTTKSCAKYIAALLELDPLTVPIQADAVLYSSWFSK